MTTYNIAGVTYNQDMVPIGFDESYTGPKNALVGEITADSGVKYGVYADYNQVNNEVQDSNGNVIANNISTINTGTVNVDSSVFSASDVQKVQNVMKTAEESNNVKAAATGLSNIPPSASDGTITGRIDNPDYSPTPSEGDPNTWPNGGRLPELKFGAVDHILQRLSLRNLTYPLDADYGNTQDYMLINQFTYQSPSGNIFFPGSMTEGFQGGVDSFTQGVPSRTARQKAIGLVKLPMPNSLVDSNNVSWGADKLNALTAAATSAAMGASGDALTGLRNFIDNLDKKNLGNNIKPFFEMMGQGLGNFGESFGEAMDKFGDADKRNINLLGRTIIGSTLLNLFQFQVSPESILSRGHGVVPNNNLALLFNSPTLREFSFAWKMSPRSREEAIRVNNILRFFKQGMAPKKGITDNSRSGGGSFFLGTPNIFALNFKTARTNNSFWEILDRNDSVMRIKDCACTGAAVNYTPEGMWSAYEKGQPTSVTLTLRFSELEPIFDTDYADNYFNYEPARTDLLPVPMDAVGY